MILIIYQLIELYYNLHIIIRYEIEEMIFNQGLDCDDLPAIWNAKYEEYLGIKPKSFSEGILQDSHWAGADFGYFPTYTLGNLISGTLYKQMKKALPNHKKDIRKGKLAPIGDFLKENIHVKGRALTVKEMVGELEVKDYLSYLTEKFEV